MLPPIVVNITRLHRKTTAVVEEAAASGSPVFVTQNSLVTAVLLHRRLYARLLRAAEKGASSACEEPPLVKSTSVLDDPLAVFGPLPPGTRFEGPWGIIDAALAAMYLEDGLEVKPILRRPYPDDE